MYFYLKFMFALQKWVGPDEKPESAMGSTIQSKIGRDAQWLSW